MAAQLEELTALEIFLLPSNECKAVHDHICTREITHLASWKCRRGSESWCVGRFDMHRVHIADERSCLGCMNPIEDCWSVRPI